MERDPEKKLPAPGTKGELVQIPHLYRWWKIILNRSRHKMIVIIAPWYGHNVYEIYKMKSYNSNKYTIGLRQKV